MNKILNSYWNVKTPSSYVDVVKDAVSETTKFEKFRQEKQYAGIVENLLEEDGWDIYHSLPGDIIELLKLTEDADSVGSPLTFNYSGLELSPTTLRYAKVLEELSGLFNNFNGINSIVEIGVGYGGQARLISQYMDRLGKKLENYTLIDLPEVLNLARLYLEHFSLKNSIQYKSKSELSQYKKKQYDLLISNYAFSEFNRPLQEEYLEKVILNSKAGYLIMNNGKTENGRHICGEFGNKDCILDIELLEIISGSKIIENNLLSSKGIYLIVFGT
ncbi:hypothetical protein NBRC116602_24030 [Hyphomicrobiales bacterium 4NK60-0047b]